MAVTAKELRASVPLEDLEAVVGELVILNVSLGQLVHREHPPRHI